MKNLQDLFEAVGKKEIRQEDVSVIRLNQQPDNVWAVGVTDKEGVEYGGLAYSTDLLREDLRLVALRGENFNSAFVKEEGKVFIR